jgi:NAD(P)-dependent dehydrogenase (short-subunit alcohol dehydrogenase family)
MADRVWFITGVGRGLGRLIAEAAQRRGDHVVGTIRASSAKAELEAAGIRTVVLDVAESSAIQSAVEQARDVHGRIDVLCNNSGFGLMGALEEVDETDYRHVFEVNVFGLMAVTRALLPHLRAQKSGWIINISSVGGISSSAGYGIYNSSKFAVEGLSESLALQLEPLGIKVLIVEPGHLRTDFLSGSSLRIAKRTIDDYARTVGHARKIAIEMDRRQPGDPVRAAAAILDVLDAPNPPLRLVLGADAVDRVRAKLAAVEREVAAWEQVGRSITYPAHRSEDDDVIKAPH